MLTLPIKTAAAEDAERIISSLVLAFSADPIVRWMYPSPQQYLEHFPDFIRTFGSKAFEQRSVYYTDNYSGAAFWLSPQSEPDTDAVAMYIQQTTSEQQQTEIFAMFEQIDNYHPHEPHWYLAILGIEPTQQNQGYGSALIEHKLEECDRQGIIAYLESSNPKNIPFYQRHGFKIIGEIQAGSSPTIFPMLRYPQSS